MLAKRKSQKLIRGRKKINYYKKNYSNPFFRGKKRKQLKLSPLSWRVKLIIAEIIVLAGGIAWFCFFSSYFTINLVSVFGAEKVSTEEIKNLAWQQAKSRRFLFGSQKNLILFSADKLTKTLNEQYYFDNLVVQKKLPDAISIKFKEKIYSAVWHQSDKYYYIDSAGSIIAETNPLEIKQKNYPLIDYLGDIEILDKKIKDDNEKIKYIIQLFNEFKYKKPAGFEIERFIINNEVNTIKMIIIGGPEIYFNITADLKKQIDKLLVIINEKLKDEFSKKTYIDLRYGDRVYYR